MSCLQQPAAATWLTAAHAVALALLPAGAAAVLLVSGRPRQLCRRRLSAAVPWEQHGSGHCVAPHARGVKPAAEVWLAG